MQSFVLQTFNRNDLVYTPYGYGVLIHLGNNNKSENKDQLQIQRIGKEPKKNDRSIILEQRIINKQKKKEIKQEKSQKRALRAQNKKSEEKQREEKKSQSQSKKEEENKIQCQNEEKNNEEEKQKDIKNEKSLQNEKKENQKKQISENGKEDEQFQIDIPLFQELQESQQEKKTKKEVNKKEEKKEDINIVTVKLKFGPTLYLQDKLVKSEITLLIKPFIQSTNRKALTLKIPIKTTISQFKNIILAKTPNNKNYANPKLYYPQGKIIELTGNNTIESYNIPNKAKIILLMQIALCWDPINKGKSLKLSNNNLTVNKTGDSEYEVLVVVFNYILDDLGECWIKCRTLLLRNSSSIDKFVEQEDIIIGISEKGIDLNSYPGNSKFWGYMCLCQKKIGPNDIFEDYGLPCKRGDIVGMLLEFNSNNGTLSFFRNQVKCGIAFNSLAKTEYYPAVSMFYGEVQVTLISKASLPVTA